MTKKAFLLAMSLFLIAGLKAQNIQDTVVNIGAQNVPGFLATVKQDVKTVENSFKQKVKAAKLKTTSSNGYDAILGQIVPDIATVPVNLYIKIADQGRKSDKVTTITICAMPMNIADRVPDMNNYVRRYLEDIIRQASRQEAAEALASAEADLKKTQKSHDNAVSDLNKLNKTIQKDQEKMASNQKEIEKLQAKINGLQETNTSLQKSLDKNTEQKAKLEKNIEESTEKLQKEQSQVEEYRKLAQ